MSSREQRLAEVRAHFRSILYLAGAHAWTRRQALAHLDDEMAKQYDGTTLQGYINLRYPNLVDFLGIGPYPAWNTSPVTAYVASNTGEKVFYYVRTTHRHVVNEILPQQAATIVQRTLALAPDTVFEVSFIGNDPVLWAVPDAGKSVPNTLSDWAEPVYVWVGHGRWAKTVHPH